MGALAYNMRKVTSPHQAQRAELLDTNFASLDTGLIRKEVEAIKMLRPTLSKYVYHTSLNFSGQEEGQLDNQKLTAIARDYLEGMGFSSNQYLIFRHYDAEHPHVHLLVNRISFDGSVVSDSNNYKKSEALVRKLEQQYNLIAVEQSSHLATGQGNKATKQPGSNKIIAQSSTITKAQAKGSALEQSRDVPIGQYNKAPLKAPTKGELEMVLRTNQPSHKMVLQEKLSSLLSENSLAMQDFISKCESEGICLLFNQASTGRVSGVTYFYENFKITGRALGDRFKWAELIKQVNYEQTRDREAISQASKRSKAIYGGAEAGRVADAQRGLGSDLGNATAYSAQFEQSTQADAADRGSAAKAGGDADEYQAAADQPAEQSGPADLLQQEYNTDSNHLDHSYAHHIGIEIADDIDDEAILGRNRRRQRKSRSNRR